MSFSFIFRSQNGLSDGVLPPQVSITGQYNSEHSFWDIWQPRWRQPGWKRVLHKNLNGFRTEVFNPHISSPTELAESVKFNTKRMACTARKGNEWAI